MDLHCKMAEFSNKNPEELKPSLQPTERRDLRRTISVHDLLVRAGQLCVVLGSSPRPPRQQIWINKTLWITKDAVGHYEEALQNDIRKTRKCQRWLLWNPMDPTASSGCFSGAQKPGAHWPVPVYRYLVGQSRVSVQLLWVGLWPWGSPVEFMLPFPEKTDQATSTERMTFISILDDDHIIIQTHLKNPQ